MKGESAIGSEAGEPYVGFYIAANRGEAAPDAFTPEVVRRFFGGAIYPQAAIEIEPLKESGRWWRAVLNNYGFEPAGTQPHRADQAASEQSVGRWRKLIRWFDEQDELHGASYIAIGEEPLSETNFGCIFPRLHVGLTRAGSIAGVFAPVAHT